MAKTYGIVCQSCGIEAPSKQIEFYQNIGALFVRFHKSIKCRLCKRCLHKHFWAMTGTTASIGWLGTISAIIAPCFVINNVVRYVAALGMPRVPEGARVPFVTNDVVQKVYPHVETVIERVNQSNDLSAVMNELAPAIGVTPGELLTYMIQWNQQRQPAPPPVGPAGFPVVMNPAMPPPMPMQPPPIPGRAPIPVAPVA